VDPAVVKFLMENEKMTPKEIDEYLNKKSGVLGISGVSSDFRDLEDAIDNGNERARLAIKIFCYRVKQYIGSYAAVMNGLDAVVFTAGIGENNPLVRGIVMENLDFLGLRIDPEKNKVRGKEMDISAEDAKARTLVIPTNEELAIARETLKLISG
jgi:acetate kinase